MRHLLIILILVTSSYAFPLTSWVSSGSDRVNLCWDPIPDATQYDLYVCGSFHGAYTFSNAVASPGIAHPHLGYIPDREFLFVKALNAAQEVISVSDTIGCYYLKHYWSNTIRSINFGIGELEYKELNGDSGCVYLDNVSTRPSDIIGAQLATGTYVTGDRIARQDNGAFAYRDQHIGWNGVLETSGSMIPGRAYSFITIDSYRRPPILTGRARSDYSISEFIPITAPTPPSNVASTPMSFPVVDVTPISELGLVSSGFADGTVLTSDRVAEQAGGRFAYLNTSGQWRGRLTECAPEAAYLIVSHTQGSVWTYNTGSIGQP